MSELKALRPRSLPARRSVKELVAEGFERRQWIRRQKREERIEYAKIYRARKRAEEAALAKQRNSAQTSAKADKRAKLPKYQQAVGGKS